MADESPFKKNALEKNDSVRSDTSSRKLRWSSCLSFVSSKFKRSSKLSSPQNIEDFHTSFRGQNNNAQVKKQIEEPLLKKVTVDPTPSTSSQWKQTISALSPPPRHSKAKRESVQIPIVPTRVNPRENKGKKATLLRLSLDAECLQSPTQSLKEEDVESVSSAGNSLDSLRPTPIRSGTLGGAKRTSGDPVIPPLPQSWLSFIHNSGSSSSVFEGSYSPTEEYDEENKRLSLKERRQRKSPSLSPNTEQLTLAINEPRTVDDQDIVWNRLSFERRASLSPEERSRQEAMTTLEGKTKTVAVQPIVNTQELDNHFNQKDKRTHPQKKIFENRLPVSRIPETPPHHQQFAPSLISVPSTPNSMDSSLMDHDDCIAQHIF
ncbi:unnamed protein product [Rhizopus stolonifer]